MMTVHGQRALIVALAIVAGTASAQAEDLEESLGFLQPLLNETWVGGYVNSPDRDLEITMRWESILGGKAVRRTIDVPALHFSGETYFYRDLKEERVAFLMPNAKGITSSGTAVKDGRTVTLRGRTYWPDRVMEFRTVVELLPDDRLTDLFYRMENGEWVQGHHQEFVAVPPGRGDKRPWPGAPSPRAAEPGSR